MIVVFECASIISFKSIVSKFEAHQTPSEGGQIFLKEMNQKQIDELLQSSSDEENQKPKVKKEKGDQGSAYDQEYENFFESEDKGDQKLNQPASKGKTKEDPKPHTKKTVEAVQEQYLDSNDFQSEPNDSKNDPKSQVGYSDNFCDEQQIKESKAEKREVQIQRTPKESDLVESQYQSENLDQIEEIKSQISESHNRSKQFANDDEMSEVQSEFIESSRMEEPIKANFKKNTFKEQNLKIQKDPGYSNKKETQKGQQQNSKKPETRVKKSQASGQSKKELSESELKQKREKLKEIEGEKKRLQQIRTKKDNEQKQKAKLEYEELKQKQQQRKKKNKQILEAQKKQKTSDKDAGLTEKLKFNILSNKKIEEIAEQEKTKKAEKSQMKTAQEQKVLRKKQAEEQKKILEIQNRKKLQVLNQEKQRYMSSKNGKSVLNKTSKQELEEKKKVAIKEKEMLQKNKSQNRRQQKKEEETVEVRKVKKQIEMLKKQIEEKKKTNFESDKNIQRLKKQLKKTEKSMYEAETDDSVKANDMQVGEEGYIDVADLSAIEKFVNMFENCQTSAEIFSLIDENRDGTLSALEIKEKIKEILSVQIEMSSETIADEVYALLDKNSDGSVTKEEFAFIVDSELKKSREYRAIMKNINEKNPIDIEAKILDMRQKIKFIDKKMLTESQNSLQAALEEKYKRLMQKAQQYEKKLSMGGSDHNSQGKDLDRGLQGEKIYFLSQQLKELRIKKQSEMQVLEKVREKQSENIKLKNMEVCQKLEESLKLQEEIYRVKVDIEERELRYLSLRKMQQNRKRYVERRTEQRQQYEESLKKAKQYQMKVLHPTRELKFGTYANEVKFLAAVIMIQRNFRKKKAMQYRQKLQNGKADKV